MFPLEYYDIPHPEVPESLDGLRILHISDLHVRAGRGPGRAVERLAGLLGDHPVDLVCLTGDYMDHPGDEGAAAEAIGLLASAWRSRLGAFGIFGNHDTAAMAGAAGSVPGVTWLAGGAARAGALPLRIVGSSDPEDLFGAMLAAGEPASPADRPFTVVLAHFPTQVYPARELGMPLVLAGHTHGGQIRLSARCAPHTSCDLPSHLASGVLRLGGTLCCVSRGLGTAFADIRVRCPAQAPVYTLRRGALPGPGACPSLRQVVAW